MKLTALRLHNVKRFAGRGVAIEGIGDGVNVLTAANEHGKSTCFEALHALFFHPHTGTASGVQMLRPYSGGSPLVEADISTASGRYRLTKQYYSGKRASVVDLETSRLIAQADEAEAFIGELIRGGTAGPAGLLWVRQGLTGIEKRSKSEEEGDKRVRESLLTSVQGEVEALTGGRRMAEVIAACEEELNRLVTATGRPKTGGPYQAALEAQQRLTEQAHILGAEVTALREALDRRRQTLVRLAELDNAEEAAQRQQAISAAEDAFEAAKSHSDALKAAEAEAALASNRHTAAADALSAYRAAQQRAAELEGQLAQAMTQRDAATERRAAALADSERASAAVAAAELAEQETRDLLTRLDAALAARAAAEQVRDMRTRLEQAEAARQQVEDGDAALALLTLPANAVEQLQALEIDLVRLRAAQAATLPTLRMDYADGKSGTVSIADDTVADGEDRGFAGSVRLDIAGVGTLTLRSNRPPQADQAIETTERKHKEMLASLGVNSLDAARQKQSQAQATTRERDLAVQRLGDLAPKGIQHVRDEVARLDSISAGALELKADPEQVRTSLATATAEVASSRNAVREIQPRRAQADQALVEAQTSHATIDATLKGLDATLGPIASRGEREAQLRAALDQQQAALDAATARLAPLRSAAHDLASAEATLRRTRSVDSAANQEAAQLRVVLAELNGQIRTQSDEAVEEAWLEARDALAAASERVQRFETEVAVLDRLRKTLVAARSAASDLYLKPVITELLPLIGLLFDDISITFDENTLLPQSVRRKGQDEDVDRLSGGMREQLSILTRLAFGRLLARDGRPAPVILDDALVYSDDDRIERMFDALHRQSRDQQIVVFSCRQRAFAKLGGNILQMTDWTPSAS
ncbi:DNA-binding protein [Devosia epidermidihirudinis]|uniref:DNA-binding protein n=1 Tax=Devosia epidermidihirudinis TaxID=1293439 RepID=A0A0F5QAS9_9HYPH|nr:AAA family ATPase [Devosia epidermidihirudinis]KKC38050.1 DNA-binding protein [Devosia epidermidihirudinis]